MKLPALLLAGSLVGNAAFLALFASRPALAPPAWRDYFSAGARATEAAANAEAEARTAALRQRRAEADATAAQSKLWSALDSGDLRTLIAQLRAAGFPPGVIRALVSERLQKQFAARLQAIAQPVLDAPYWKPSPTESSNNRKFFEETNQLYRERAKVMRELLGDDFFANSGADPTAAQRRQFGDLSKSKIEMLQRINDDYAELTSQVRGAMQGIALPEDREKLALLEREKHADLAAVLTPAELEDYEMRTSNLTNRLRGTLTLLDASEAEFRTIYRIEQPFAEKIYPAGGVGVVGAEQAQQRREAEAQMNEQLKAALGDERYAEFSRAGNFEFQSLVRLTQRENLPMSAANAAYDLRDSTSQAAIRIGDDKAMSYEDKLAGLQTLAQATRAKMIETLGPNIGPSYAKSANWLQAIEHGNIVEFKGTTTFFRQVQRTAPPTR